MVVVVIMNAVHTMQAELQVVVVVVIMAEQLI